MKKVQMKRTNKQMHWVGDGFPVKNLFSYNDIANKISPFLLLDYAAPTEFSPTHLRRGVGAHPHRGFETVTFVYEGEVEHRDSSGGGGVIRSGDVQWMTAASGIVHEEFHSADYAKRGGPFEMVQLWVNLPAKHKMDAPRYQALESRSFPEVELSNESGRLRVIAGEVFGEKGPAKTFTPMNMWDVRLNQGARQVFEVPEGHTALVLVLDGSVSIGTETMESAELAVLEQRGTQFELVANKLSKVLFLGGEPIPEPIVGHGPFVMNSESEIRQAILDYQQGRMGRL